MLLASVLGSAILWSAFLVIWIAIACWQALVAARTGNSLFRFSHRQPELLPVRADTGLRGRRAHPPRLRADALDPQGQ